MAGEGKKFEASIEKSAKDQNIFFFRVRDVDPTAIKKGKSVPKNRYDCLMFHEGYLFPAELKSTKQKSISFSESIIKEYQIKNLIDAATYDKVIPGFIMNFREPEDKTYFIHINDFIEYMNIAQNQLLHTYKSKINKSSIPIAICEEIGVEVVSAKKVKNYRYYINKLCNDLIDKYK